LLLADRRKVNLPLITERLVLRRFAIDDVQGLLELVRQPSVARVMRGIEPTEASVTNYLAIQTSYQPFEQDRCFDVALESKSDGQVIGLLSLVRRDHRKAEIGWSLGVAHRGQGYVTEGARALMAYGFATLGLHRIYATTSNINTRSWRVMERLGMRREGHLREAELRDGEWIDVLIYGILDREWQAGALAMGTSA
jgi:RimJ/RimL family protein N-acetyltransferase